MGLKKFFFLVIFVIIREDSSEKNTFIEKSCKVNLFKNVNSFRVKENKKKTKKKKKEQMRIIFFCFSYACSQKILLIAKNIACSQKCCIRNC